MERVNITVPQLGEGIHQVRVISLLVKPSQQVNRDDPFAEVETDKATLVIESPVTGVVREILCQSGDTIEVGATFAWVDGVPGGHDAKAMDAAVSSIKTPADRVKAAPIVAQHPGVRNAVASPRQQALMRQGAGQTGAPAAARDESGGLLSQRQQLLGQRLREFAFGHRGGDDRNGVGLDRDRSEQTSLRYSPHADRNGTRGLGGGARDARASVVPHSASNSAVRRHYRRRSIWGSLWRSPRTS